MIVVVVVIYLPTPADSIAVWSHLWPSWVKRRWGGRSPLSQGRLPRMGSLGRQGRDPRPGAAGPEEEEGLVPGADQYTTRTGMETTATRHKRRNAGETEGRKERGETKEVREESRDENMVVTGWREG